MRAYKIIPALLVFLFLINYTGFAGDQLSRGKDIFFIIVTPVQEFLYDTGTELRDFKRGVSEGWMLKVENRALKQELAAKQGLANKLKELEKENQRLREMLEFKEETGHDLLAARVIARDPSCWFETITINKGYNDGVASGMTVATPTGLAGVVRSVYPEASRVQLLTDSQASVSAMVQSSRDPGQVSFLERKPHETGYFQMVKLPPDAEIEQGDTVISSGLGEVFPKGLVLGRVLEVEKDQQGLLLQAALEPAVDFNRLEEVFVVRESNF